MRRAIEVTPDVFHLIWANWREGDSDENSILKRVLSMPSPSDSLKTALTDTSLAFEKANALAIVEGFRDDKASFTEPKEIKLYRQEESPAMGKIRWVDDVRSALIALGGEADLPAIYRETEEIRRTGGRTIVRSLDATVRQTIEAHSSDSRNFKPGNSDYFGHVGRGRWRLRR